MSNTTFAPPSRGDAAPLFAQVRDALRASIVDGTLRPGEQLPSEAQLAERFKVSRITIRQAIAELLAHALVITINGKGTFVTKASEPSHLGPLAGFMRQMQRRGHQVAGRLLSATPVIASGIVATELDVAEGRSLTVIKIARDVDGRPAAIGTLYTSQALAKRMIAAGVGEKDVTAVLEMDLAIRIGKSHVNVSAICADARLARALRYETGKPVLDVRTTIIDIDNIPVLHSHVSFRGDVMDYKVTVKR